MDVKFEIQDLFEKLRPNAKIHETLEEAAEALNEIIAKQIKRPETTEAVGDGSDHSEKSDDEQEERGLDEEPVEEDEKPEEMEVSSILIQLADYRLTPRETWKKRKKRTSYYSIAKSNQKLMKNSTVNSPASCLNRSSLAKQLGNRPLISSLQRPATAWPPTLATK